MKKVFSRTVILLACTIVPFVACSSGQTVHNEEGGIPSWKQEVNELDSEIDHLVNQRNLYLAKATRYQNQGDRLQFQRNDLLDARQAWSQAELSREIAAKIQTEIDILEEKRGKILKSHGIKNPPKRSETKS